MDDARRHITGAQFKRLKRALADRDWPEAERAYAWVLPILEELLENSAESLQIYRAIGDGIARKARESPPPSTD